MGPRSSSQARHAHRDNIYIIRAWCKMLPRQSPRVGRLEPSYQSGSQLLQARSVSMATDDKPLGGHPPNFGWVKLVHQFPVKLTRMLVRPHHPAGVLQQHWRKVSLGEGIA